MFAANVPPPPLRWIPGATEGRSICLLRVVGSVSVLDHYVE